MIFGLLKPERGRLSSRKNNYPTSALKVVWISAVLRTQKNVLRTFELVILFCNVFVLRKPLLSWTVQTRELIHQRYLMCVMKCKNSHKFINCRSWDGLWSYTCITSTAVSKWSFFIWLRIDVNTWRHVLMKFHDSGHQRSIQSVTFRWFYDTFFRVKFEYFVNFAEFKT